jgi:toxin ParE1/3/4
MAYVINTYRLSAEAEEDLGEIFDYTEQQFGSEQAATYLYELEASLLTLLANPNAGRERNEIRAGLRSITPNSHVIFYRICDDHIRVVRVLHGSRDLPRFF